MKAYELDVFNCRKIDLNRLKDELSGLDITNIRFGIDLLVDDRLFEFTDKDNPVIYTDFVVFGNTLMFNEEYFKGLEKELEEIVIEVCKISKSQTISICDTSLITKYVLEAIRDNDNIKTIRLGSEKDIYKLDEYWYKQFKEAKKTIVYTSGVTNGLKDNYDSMIAYNNSKNLIGGYTYSNLRNMGAITIKEKLSKEEMNNLKYLDSESRVQLKINDFNQVMEIIKKLKRMGHEGDFFILLDNKNDFNSYIFNNFDKLPEDIKNIYVLVNDRNQVRLSEYLKYEKVLMDLVLPAMNMSPFEKYLYVYNKVKNYKPYKECEEDKLSARKLYSILDNEYMVCAGYSVLLGDLLDKLGIETIYYSVSVDCGLDEIESDTIVLPDYIIDKKTDEEKEVLTEESHHARRIVHLVDPKYDIDGYYFSDPTWDNNDKVDTYNYALMTNVEYIGMDRYNYLKTWNFYELLFISDLEDFYNKINILLNKNPKKSEKDIIKFFVDFFKEVDREFYLKLIEFNNGITKYNYKYNKEEIQDLFLFIGEHLLEKVDNLVDGYTFKDGITEIYRIHHKGTEKELEEKVNEVMSINKKKHALSFPMRYKIDKDDNSLVILNPYNKFDLEKEHKLVI